MDQKFENKEQPEQVAKDSVVSIEYTLHVEGEMVDSSEEGEPLEYIQGHNQIIPGLENALQGMSVGQSKEVLVPASDAYGDVDPEAIIEVNRADFPPDMPVEIGTPVQVRNMDGHVLDAHIAEINGDQVKLDFNHPLAGKDLQFNVTIVGLRSASEEELEHGHVHGEHGHDDFLFEDEEDDEFEEYDDEDNEAK